MRLIVSVPPTRAIKSQGSHPLADGFSSYYVYRSMTGRRGFYSCCTRFAYDGIYVASVIFQHSFVATE